MKVDEVNEDSAAENAGIRAGAVITSINGRGVRDSDDLVREIEGIDDEATILILRDQKEMTLKATLTRK